MRRVGEDCNGLSEVTTYELRYNEEHRHKSDQEQFFLGLLVSLLCPLLESVEI